jgi:CheY-like chemotaxis protein
MNESSRASAFIFLVDDNPADVYLVRHALKENEVLHEMQVASDGEEALAFLSREPALAEQSTPALIVLDLNLPRHDGMEVLRYIRQHDRLASVPVMILTSSNSPKDRCTATALGATEYLQKPCSLHEFIAIGSVIKRVLAEHSSQPRVRG